MAAVQEQVLKGITGPFGALTLACGMLYFVMDNYQSLVDQLISDHAADRALYRETMSQLQNEMKNVSNDIQGIRGDIQDIRRDLSSDR